MKKYDQITRTRFLAKYVGLSIYDIDIGSRYTIEDEYINFLKVYGYALIGNPENPYGTSTYHSFFHL